MDPLVLTANLQRAGFLGISVPAGWTNGSASKESEVVQPSEALSIAQSSTDFYAQNDA